MIFSLVFYVECRAVAHAAGFFASEANRSLDADGIDLEVFARGKLGIVQSPRVSLQIKSTTFYSASEKSLSLNLSIKNYNELRDENSQLPRLLVAVVVPENIQEWIYQTEESLVLKRCGYWQNLIGQAESENKQTITVKINCSQVWDVSNVQTLMQRIGNKEAP